MVKRCKMSNITDPNTPSLVPHSLCCTKECLPSDHSVTLIWLIKDQKEEALIVRLMTSKYSWQSSGIEQSALYRSFISQIHWSSGQLSAIKVGRYLEKYVRLHLLHTIYYCNLPIHSFCHFVLRLRIFCCFVICCLVTFAVFGSFCCSVIRSSVVYPSVFRP